MTDVTMSSCSPPAAPFVVVGQGAEPFSAIRRSRAQEVRAALSSSAALALGRHRELGLELLRAWPRPRTGSPRRAAFEPVHLEELEVAPEDAGEAGHVRVDVEHAAVIVPEDADPRVADGRSDRNRLHPGRDLAPGVVLLEPTR